MDQSGDGRLGSPGSRSNENSGLKKPDVPPEHAHFLQKKNFSLLVSNEEIFQPYELKILKRYGFWLGALADGSIQPITIAQKHFVEVCNGAAEPETTAERAWTRLVARRAIEPDLARDYEITDPAEQWFSRDAHWRNR
jgi:uncharacterized protein YifE (UPF0438 family)